MMRRTALALVVLCASVPMSVGQGAAHAAAPDRLQIARTGTDAAVIKVPARNDTLAVGSRLNGAVYTWAQGDPPCDPTGSTVYAGHAWRAGNGVADRWGQLRRGDVVRVAGCRFKVTAREFWPAKRRMGSLYSVSGPARIVLVGCKADDYSKRTVVFARKIGR
ncbi:class F sortase [Nocardioides alpinus]|nr:class F sortase [Nocardioides alpinus]